MHTLSLSLSHAKKRIEKFTKNVRPFLVKSFTFPIKIVFKTVKSLQMEKGVRGNGICLNVLIFSDPPLIG